MDGHPPPPDIEVDEELIRSLLSAQHSDLAGLPLGERHTGWDNVTVRLGADLAVRVPHRKVAAPLIRNEQRFLPAIAAAVEVSVPAPVRAGTPTEDFPWHWSVVPWVGGRRWLDESPNHDAGAPDLTRFLARLHALPVPDVAPRNPYRGIPLRERPSLIPRLEALAAVLTTPHVEAAAEIWTRAVAAPIDGARSWLHGDLHGKNVIVHDGAVTGVIDWGDMCVGDVATDLAAAWSLLPLDHHRDFWHVYGATSAATRLRAAGWALAFGVMLYEHHCEADPEFAAAALRTVRCVVEDFSADRTVEP